MPNMRDLSSQPLDGLSLLLAARTSAAQERARWLEVELRAAIARADRALAGAS